MSALTRTFEEATEEAAEKGLIVCTPADNELQLDIDFEEIPKRVEDNIAGLRKHVLSAYSRPITVERTRSPSGKHWHIRIFLPWEVSQKERVMWQAVLGSDPLRELLSAFRILLDDENPTLFFEKPDWQRADLNEPVNSVLDT